MSQLKIFVSYSWQDKLNSSIVKTIMNRLQNDGWNPWIDVHDLDHGQEMNKTIGKVIKGTDVALIMWSGNYAASQNCLFELIKIKEMGVSFIPCDVEGYTREHPLVYNVKWMNFTGTIKGMPGVEWGWLQLRQHLLELEAKLYGTPDIIDEIDDIRLGVGELENTIYRMKKEASSNDHSDPFIQQMMKMAIQMAENDPMYGYKYITFCTMLSDISRQHPTRSEDRLKRQKMLHAIDIADPEGALPVLQRLRMMTELSLLQG